MNSFLPRGGWPHEESGEKESASCEEERERAGRDGQRGEKERKQKSERMRDIS